MTGWRAVREQGRGEDGAEDLEALDFGDQHAEAVARMCNVLAAEPEHDARHGRVAHPGERREVEPGGPSRFHLQLRELERGAGIEDGTVLIFAMPSRALEGHRPAASDLF